MDLLTFCGLETPKWVVLLQSLCEDPDEKLHDVAFRQGLHCFLQQNEFSEKEIKHYWEVLPYDPTIYTMEHPYFIVFSLMENSIGLKRVKAQIWCSMGMFQVS